MSVDPDQTVDASGLDPTPLRPRSPVQTALAPMEGVTLFATRLWIHWASQPTHMTTPFLRVSRTQPEGALPLLFAPELFELKNVLPYALTPQFLSADPEGFLRASAYLEGEIELNCGCPCPTCIGKAAGSGILADPVAFGRTTQRLATELGPRRLAIKMRLGYASDDEFEELLARVAPLPLARLTIHGRTRADSYRGTARWSAVQKAATRAYAPTWGSGDIVDSESFATLMALAPDAAGAMIGRGAIRNPWIFEELRRGAPIEMTFATLANALLAFLLVHELSMAAPSLLVTKLAAGKLLSPCRTDHDAWEKVAATLAALVSGIPVTWGSIDALDDRHISPTALARLRYLWSQLHTCLPEPLARPRLSRAKTASDFFTQLHDLGQEAPPVISLKARS